MFVQRFVLLLFRCVVAVVVGVVVIFSVMLNERLAFIMIWSYAYYCLSLVLRCSTITVY